METVIEHRIVKSNTKQIHYHSDTFNEDMYEIALRVKIHYLTYDIPWPTTILYLPRGGAVPATHLSHLLNIKQVLPVTRKCNSLLDILSSERSVLLIDDISDTGKQLANTIQLLQSYQRLRDIQNTPFHLRTITPWIRQNTRVRPDIFVRELQGDSWIIFPWETTMRPTRIVWLPDQWNCNLFGVV